MNLHSVFEYQSEEPQSWSVDGVSSEKNSRDTCNFDREFTKMPTELTPTDKLFIMNLDQDEFLGFSYTNPEYVPPNQG
ncbi:hypothetical protein AOLI_G00173130 [Acnodon oligacanthus]